LPGFLDHPDDVNRKLKLLFLSCGTEDPRYIGQLDLADNLKRRGIRYVWYPTSGVHEWKVWRHALAESRRGLFRKNVRSTATTDLHLRTGQRCAMAAQTRP
jgi:hypothetical protein